MARLRAVTGLGLALVVAGGAGGAGGSTASMSGWFFREGGSIYCGTELFPHEGSARFLACWRPRNGFAVSMTHRGPARVVGRAYRGHRPPTAGRLRFGQTVWVDSDRRLGHGAPPPGALFWCSARATGLTCKNGSGYGWRLGRTRGYWLIGRG